MYGLLFYTYQTVVLLVVAHEIIVNVRHFAPFWGTNGCVGVLGGGGGLQKTAGKIVLFFSGVFVANYSRYKMHTTVKTQTMPRSEDEGCVEAVQMFRAGVSKCH